MFKDIDSLVDNFQNFVFRIAQEYVGMHFLKRSSTIKLCSVIILFSLIDRYNYHLIICNPTIDAE